MARITFTIPDEMYEALLAEAEKRGTPYSYLVREYVGRGLEADGRQLSKRQVRWGGNRRPDKPDKSPG